MFDVIATRLEPGEWIEVTHGLLTLSLLSNLIEGNGIMPESTVMELNYGFDKVRFLVPIRAGKNIRCHAKVLDVEHKDDNRFLVKQGISVETECEDTPALVAEWISMLVTAEVITNIAC